MEVEETRTYTTKELASLAGVSTRTLRYYDQIGLLVPSRAQNGYRAYSRDDISRLQDILLLRSCGMPLESIRAALGSSGSDLSSMLREHLAVLCSKREELDKTIAAVRIAAAGLEEFRKMDDAERFEHLKKQYVAEYEEEYGDEARMRYGDSAVDEANERLLGMSRTAWDALKELEQRIKNSLTAAMATGDPGSPESRLVAGMHTQWLKIRWGESAYSPEAHAALAEGYVSDPRFTQYYDEACGKGAAEFLRDIIRHNTGQPVMD